MTVCEVNGQLISCENRLTNRRLFQGERSQLLICHMGVKLIADHLENGIKSGKMQALKKNVIGYLIALLYRISRHKSSLIGIGRPTGTLAINFVS